MAPRAPGWGAPWSEALLYPTTGVILITIDKSDDIFRLPPFLPPGTEPKIEIVTKLASDKYARVSSKSEEGADGWSLGTMTKTVAELIYSAWKDDIETLKENNDNWRHFMDRFTELECEDREIDSFEINELDTKYRNTMRQKTWAQAITIKSTYEKLAQRIKESFDKTFS